MEVYKKTFTDYGSDGFHSCPIFPTYLDLHNSILATTQQETACHPHPQLHTALIPPTPKFPEYTDRWCWWDCHPINGRPFPLPLQKKKDGSYVLSSPEVFCSPHCALAHIKHHYRGKTERAYKIIQLIYEVAKSYYGYKSISLYTNKLADAPDRRALEVFSPSGISIETFRNQGLKEHSVRFVMLPPMVVTQSQIIEAQDSHMRGVRMATDYQGKSMTAPKKMTESERLNKYFDIPVNSPTSTISTSSTPIIRKTLASYFE